MLLYIYHNVTTSAQAGIRMADRSAVHMAIIGIVAALGAYVCWHRQRSISGKEQYLSVPIICIGVWIVLTDIMNGRALNYTLFNLLYCAWWVLSVKFFQMYVQRNVRKYSPFAWMFVALFIASIVENLYAREQMQLIHDLGTTVFIYDVVLLLPPLLLVRSNKFRWLAVVVTLVMVITSFKRGALITYPAMLFAYFYVVSAQRGNKLTFLRKAIPAAVLLGLILVYVDNAAGGVWAERMSSQELASGSGRDQLRAVLTKALEQRDAFSLMIGSGSHSSVDLLETGAHNEWLEFIFSFGIVGVLLYAWMCLRCVRYALWTVRAKLSVAPMVCMLCVYLLICGMFSGFFFMQNAFYFWTFFGISVGMSNNELVERSCLR